MDIPIIYEDSDILAVDKPAGMHVHPSPGHESGTLTDVLLADYPELVRAGSVERPGIVHRLDRDTSGVMILARTKRAYIALRQAFESHVSVRKTYLGVLHGAPKPRKGTVETLIGRKPWDPKRMAVVEENGARAVTHWEFLGKQGPVALVEFRIETGRTHQIRVHAAHIGHPIAGDALYGDRKADRRMAVPPRRQLLHALGLELSHPVTGKPLSLMAEPPPDIVYAH